MLVVQDGDIIETERGVRLNIIEKNGVLYIKNSASSGVSLFSRLAVPFIIISRK